MRIVSLAPSNTEILYSIGAANRIVATTSLCDHPTEARQKPSVGGWTNPEIDRIQKFEPDLIMASDDLQDRAVEKLEDTGFDVFQVKPHSLEEVFKSIVSIGERIGMESEAEAVVSEMQAELEGFELKDSPRIYCEEWMDPPMVSGNWIPDLVRYIGGEYFIDGGRSREFDLQELKGFDPEYIFLNVCGAGDNLSPEEVLKRDDWSEITAVQEENVHVIDDALLNRPGPRLVEGAKTVSSYID
ncbi:MAG: cobalamin-binding protein [Candidatus Nanohaloarchaea archaeon]